MVEKIVERKNAFWKQTTIRARKLRNEKKIEQAIYKTAELKRILFVHNVIEENSDVAAGVVRVDTR